MSLKFIIFHTVLDGFPQLSAAWYRYDPGIKKKNGVTLEKEISNLF